MTLEGIYSLGDDATSELGVPAEFVAPGPGVPGPFDWSRSKYDEDEVFGGRATIRWAMDPGSALELRGTYYGGYEGTSRQTGVFGFTPGPAGLGGLSAVNTATLELEADLYGGGFTYWEELFCRGRSRLDVGLGACYFRFEEKASATDWADVIIPGGGAAVLSSRARNSFAGVQVGVCWHLDLAQSFEFRVAARGLAGNLNQKCSVRDANVLAGGAHHSQVEYSSIRLGADVDVGFLWRWTSWLGLTGGYNLLLLDGVARADRVMDFTHSVSGAVQAREADEQILVHSFFLGFNLTF